MADVEFTASGSLTFSQIDGSTQVLGTLSGSLTPIFWSDVNLVQPLTLISDPDGLRISLNGIFPIASVSLPAFVTAGPEIQLETEHQISVVMLTQADEDSLQGETVFGLFDPNIQAEVTLVYEYDVVPVPASIIAMTTALVGLAALHRRRSRVR